MQHLNLCTQLDRQVEPPYSARQQLWALGLGSVFMLLLFGALTIAHSISNAELAKLQQQQQQLTQAVETLAAQKNKLLADKTLGEEIKHLQADIEFRRQLLQSIDPDAANLGDGFAGHLEGLARQHIEGMWFTEIQLLAGGTELALVGHTNAPEYVPRYLQKLADEELFSGLQFRIFRMSTAEERRDLLDFELRAKELGLP